MRAPIKQLPTQAELLALLDYDPETGALIWRCSCGSRAAGQSAGTVTKGRTKYLAVGIRKNGKTIYYFAHRLIWKMMTGNDPPEFIDHVDGDKLNQRWANLREASNGKNLHNAKLRVDNKSGVKGVCWDEYHNKWVAYISIDAHQQRLGRFDSLDDAAAAVAAERTKLHGTFARYR